MMVGWVFFLLAPALFAVVGGCGQQAGGADGGFSSAERFAGTWQWSGGNVSTTCDSGESHQAPLEGSFVFVAESPTQLRLISNDDRCEDVYYVVMGDQASAETPVSCVIDVPPPPEGPGGTTTTTLESDVRLLVDDSSQYANLASVVRVESDTGTVTCDTQAEGTAMRTDRSTLYAASVPNGLREVRWDWRSVGVRSRELDQ